MKISFFDDEPEIYPLQYGGKARTITNLAKEFIKRKEVDKVTILSRSIKNDGKEFIKDGVLYVPLDDTNTIKKIKEASEEADILNIHCCSFTFPLFKSKAKKIYFLHDVLIATAEKGSHLDKSLGNSYDYVMAPSEYAKKIYDYNKKILGMESNCIVVPRHIDKDIFNQMSKEEILKQKDVPKILKEAMKKYEKIIFFPSRPIEEKGGKYIFDIANQLLENNICIIGPLGSNQNLPCNCIDSGWIKSDKLKYFYSAADVTCNFSILPESFSQVCIESIYCATPVVSFGSGNIDCLSKLTKAILICDKTKESIISTLKKAMKLKKDNIKMKQEQNIISKEFDKDKIINKYIEIYKELLEE